MYIPDRRSVAGMSSPPTTASAATNAAIKYKNKLILAALLSLTLVSVGANSSANRILSPDMVGPLHWAVCGRFGKCNKENTYLAEESELHEVRCCSDDIITDWEIRSDCDVWGGSTIDGDCHSRKTFSEAEIICGSVGARLCTKAELEGDCTKNTGCHFNNDLVWSQTAVPTSAPVAPVPDITSPPIATPLISRASALNVDIAPFSTEILSGYASCTDLRDDIINALKHEAKQVVERNINKNSNHCFFRTVARGDSGGGGSSAIAEGAVADSPTGADAAKDASGEDSFETNNQVDGVEEADPIQSDGTHIFAAYGTDILVMDLEGEIVARVTVPQPKTETKTKQSTNLRTGTSTKDTFHRKMSMPMPWGGGEMKTKVKALLLHEGRLVAIANKPQDSNSDLLFPRKTRGISGGMVSGGTTVSFTYKFDANSMEKLKLVHQMDILGSYKTARAIQANLNIVSYAYINTWAFTNSLDRCSSFQGLSNDEYEAAATKYAIDNVETYADVLMKELFRNNDGEGIDDNACTHFVRINSMTTGTSTSEKDKHINSGGILKSFAQVTSFDLTKADQVEVQCIQTPCDSLTIEPTVSTAAMFFPTGSVETYASAEKLVLAGRGYRYTTDGSSAYPYTYLLGFGLDGDVAAAVPTAIGEVQGTVLNSYSMDWWDGHLRVATTKSARGSWVSVTKQNSKGEDFISSTFEIESKSSSQVTILELDGSQMVQTGLVDNLGIDEQIYATRFIRDKVFIVTFRQVDPLYAIDLSDHNNPVIMGELKITGFSNYMKLVQGNYLLTVGQEADESTGRQTGLKIALFDISDMTNPIEAQEPYVEGKGSSSVSQYDFHAFRYLEESKRLVIPVSNRWSWWSEEKDEEEFDGFKVYNVDATKKIEPSAFVTHANDSNFGGCYSDARLPSRSMVFNGELVTFKGHSMLKSTNLTKPADVWTINLDEGRERTDKFCFGWWR